MRLLALALALGPQAASGLQLGSAQAVDERTYRAAVQRAAHAVQQGRWSEARAELAATAPALRGWEFRHLQARLDCSWPAPFEPSTGLTQGASSRNGDAFVTLQTQAGRSALRVFGTRDWDQRLELVAAESASTRAFTSAALSPTGDELLVGATRAPHLERYAVATGRRLGNAFQLDAEGAGSLLRVGWLRGTERCYGLTEARGLWVWETESGRQLAHFPEVQQACAIAGERWLMVLVDGEVALIDTDELDLRRSGRRPGSGAAEVQQWSASPRGGVLAAGLSDGRIEVLRVAGGELERVRELPAVVGELLDLAFTGDGRSLAILGAAQRLSLWSWESDQPPQVLALESQPHALGRLPGGNDLLLCEAEGAARILPEEVLDPTRLDSRLEQVEAVCVRGAGETGRFDRHIPRTCRLEL